MRALLFVVLAASLSLPAFAADAPGAPAPNQSAPLMSTPESAPPPAFPDTYDYQVMPAPPPPPSRDGALTGGDCAHDKDCLLGCAANSKEITCLNTKEGSDMCLKDRFYIAPSRSCGCLPDIHRCGFLNPNVRHY